MTSTAPLSSTSPISNTTYAEFSRSDMSQMVLDINYAGGFEEMTGNNIARNKIVVPIVGTSSTRCVSMLSQQKHFITQHSKSPIIDMLENMDEKSLLRYGGRLGFYEPTEVLYRNDALVLSPNYDRCSFDPIVCRPNTYFRIDGYKYLKTNCHMLIVLRHPIEKKRFEYYTQPDRQPHNP